MDPSLLWLEDPTVFRVNRLDAHSDHTVYPSADELATGRSSLYQCLDGQWKFRWSSCPAQRPADFWQEDFDDSAFDTITVPGHMETQGYDRLQYINKLYDWDGHVFLRPPHIDREFDPVGSYVTCFDLDEGLQGKPVCISLQGVEEAFYLWLNGHFVGYSEDSFTPSDFDLSPYIRSSGNRLCVEVYKRSSAAWLEDQDFFSFSGIFRSVILYARMPVAVEDVWFNTSLDTDLKTGRLTVRLKTSGEALSAAYLTLKSPDGAEMLNTPLSFTERDGFLFSPELVLPEVALWDYGSPNLYHLELQIEEGGLIPYDIGFRRFEIVDKIMTLNGKRLMLNGVNRHEWNPSTGRCITLADMDTAMKVFHRNNINAVRTCHYPNRSEWYFLCDREGIYMMDETNMETHGSWQKDMTVNPEWNIPGSLPEWLDCVLDRANSMFQRDKNHAAILFWSCGNESFAGDDIAAIADFFRREDPGRIVHYEGCYWYKEYSFISDMESRMYATPTEVRDYLESDPIKPYLNCEYMHNMGNSLGGMESYVKLGEEFPLYQGGFIWDFMDQALWHKNAQGKQVLGYGGDFDDRNSDYSFSANGLLTADGIEKPCMQEVRYWYSTPDQRTELDRVRLDAVRSTKPLDIPPKAGALRFVDGDGSWGLRGKDFEVLFSKLSDGPISIVSDGAEWLWRAPRPAFWRAPTENDMGCGFPQRAAVWSAVDSWLKCVSRTVRENNAARFTVEYRYSADAMLDLDVSVTYTLLATGELKVACHYSGRAGRPELPLFGLRFSTPHPIDRTIWTGLSGETYPDRYKGAVFGTFEEAPHLPPYLVPQECGNHTCTHSTEFHMGGATLAMEKVEQNYHFSALPYTPHQLEEAFHVDELPKPCRTVITVCGAMRGVGGIDTWMTDVEKKYHVKSDRDIDFSFMLHL